jgi:hypothetical protein
MFNRNKSQDSVNSITVRKIKALKLSSSCVVATNFQALTHFMNVSFVESVKCRLLYEGDLLEYLFLLLMGDSFSRRPHPIIR